MANKNARLSASGAAADGESGRAVLRDFARDFYNFSGAETWRAAALVLAGAFVEGVGLLLLVPLLSVVLDSGPGSGLLGSISRHVITLLPFGGAAARLAALLAVFGILVAFRSWVLIRRDLLLARLQIGYVQDRRLRIMRRLAEAPWEAVSRLRHGRIAHLLGPDMFALRDTAHYLVQCGVSAVMLGINLVLAFLISPLLALALLTLLAVGALALRPLVRRSRDFGAALSDAHLALMDNANQFLGGLKLALSQNLQCSYVEEFELTLNDAASRQIAFARQRAVTQVALVSFAAFVAGAALLIDAALVGSSAASLIALLIVLARMNGPATVLQQGSQQIFHALPAFAKLKQLEEDLPVIEMRGSAAGAEQIGWDIEFRDVSFRHRREGADPLGGGLSNLSISIPEGSFVGLIGASGAGKTTFADLLVGLYPPQSGCIRIGGRSLEGPGLGAWRDAISYVSQDPYLFHDTIRANLLWARPSANEEEVWAALRMAGAEQLARSLPEGLDTVVGERGGLLSGGERQRIALARALIRRPRLLILDEATNALDIASEAAVLATLGALDQRPTILMIAHREQSLAACERIITLEKGTLAADGRAGS